MNEIIIYNDSNKIIEPHSGDIVEINDISDYVYGYRRIQDAIYNSKQLEVIVRDNYCLNAYIKMQKMYGEEKIKIKRNYYREKIEDMIDKIVDRLKDIEGIYAYKRFPGDSGEPYPFCEIRILGENSSVRRDALIRRLKQWDPPIAVSSIFRDLISINALTLRDGEEEIITDAIAQIMPRINENST